MNFSLTATTHMYVNVGHEKLQVKEGRRRKKGKRKHTHIQENSTQHTHA